MKSIQKILIPTDFSPFSLAATSFVTSMPMFEGAELCLLHVVSDPVVMAPYPNVDLNAETIFRDGEERARQGLELCIRQNFAPNRRVTPIIRRGDAAREIIACAVEEQADLVVIATHGRTGLAHMLLGSVAEKVVRSCHVPVLTIKPEEVRSAMAGRKEEAHEAVS